jgi:hypothetical protein
MLVDPKKINLAEADIERESHIPRLVDGACI